MNGLLAVSRSFGDINYKAVDESLFEHATTTTATATTSPIVQAIADAEQMLAWSQTQQVTGVPEVLECQFDIVVFRLSSCCEMHDDQSRY